MQKLFPLYLAKPIQFLTNTFPHLRAEKIMQAALSTASLDDFVLVEQRRKTLERATTAMALFHAGQIKEGLTLYRRLLMLEDGSLLPVALHAQMLEQAGQHETAAELYSLGRMYGANLALKGALDDYDMLEVISEFEALFAKGEATSRMIARYLVMLSLTRSPEKMSVLANPDLIKIVDLTEPDEGRPTINPSEIEHAIMTRISPETWQEKKHSTLFNHRIEAIHSVEDPAIKTLMQAMETEALKYRDQVEKILHPVLRWIPKSLKPEGWALVSEGEGHASSHIHPRGWITGVYYPAAPIVSSDDNQGTLHIGKPLFMPEEALGWPDIRFSPKPGKLVLLPSWFSHWTFPLQEPGLRIAVAIDFVDSRDEYHGSRERTAIH